MNPILSNSILSNRDVIVFFQVLELLEKVLEYQFVCRANDVRSNIIVKAG